MQLGTMGRIVLGVGIAGAAVGGAVGAAKAWGDHDPWTLDYGGPGSIEQVPSMFAPWLLPGTAAGAGALVLMDRGHTVGAAALGIGAAALAGAGFTTWVMGKSRD
jgi:hypothetical protein